MNISKEDLLKQYKESNDELVGENTNLKFRLSKQKDASREHEALIDKLNRELTEANTNLDTAMSGNEDLHLSLVRSNKSLEKLINILDKVVK